MQEFVAGLEVQPEKGPTYADRIMTMKLRTYTMVCLAEVVLSLVKDGFMWSTDQLLRLRVDVDVEFKGRLEVCLATVF